MNQKIKGLKYWSEISGPIEQLCIENNAYPIPNDFASDILNISNITLSDDGVHYSRIINIPDDPDTKMLVGFKDISTYNMVMDKMGDVYEKFRKQVNGINESFITYNNIPLKIRKLLCIYELFWQLYFEQGHAEISQKLYNLLKYVTNKLKDAPKQYTSYLEDIDDLLKYFTVLKLHKF